MKDKTAKGEKLNYKLTILTGFGFLATSIAWAIYDPYVTKILNKLLSESELITRWSQNLQGNDFISRFMSTQGESTLTSAGAFTLVPLFIGIIMTFDNIFGVIFQPAFGKLSDNCHSRLGKRRPFIVFGAPISAVLFAMIPNMKTLPATMAVLILFVFVMSLWRAPVVALMPDLTKPELRSEGNAVINLMGGFGSLVGMIAGTIVLMVYAFIHGVPKKNVDEFELFPAVFAIGAVIMVVGMLVLLFFVKEDDSRLKILSDELSAKDAAAKRRAEKAARRAEKLELKKIKLTKGERISLLLFLVGLFFMFCGTNAITTFFTLFADEILHKKTAQATLLMVILAVSAAIAAIPAGAMGKKFGRKKTILAGLAVFISVFIVFFSVFLVMINTKDLSVSKYITINQSYVDLQNVVADKNEEIKNLPGYTEAQLLNVDEYIDYKHSGKVEGLNDVSKYTAFDKELIEDNFKFENYLEINKKYLGNEDIGTDIGKALFNIKEAVKYVSGILNILIFPVLVLAGAANMSITVNTLPLVLEIGGIKKVGTFTGYYYTATFSAQIASPIVYGIFRMFSGSYISLFYYSPIAFLIAILFFIGVKHGEAIPQEIIDEAQQDD